MKVYFLIACGLAGSSSILPRPVLAAPVFSVVYAFKGAADGYSPTGLLRDETGIFYGAARLGVAPYGGVLFKVAPGHQESVLYNFSTQADGEMPGGLLLRDPNGTLYGTTQDGGTYSAGTVFQLTPDGSKTILHSFDPGPEGGTPQSNLARSSAGALTGTLALGGHSQKGNDVGAAYRVTRGGAFRPLFRFSSDVTGLEPAGSIALDSVGNLYGTSEIGGVFNQGKVFRISHGKETGLHDFGASGDGAMPVGVTRDSAGNLYGFTEYGGVGCGTAFKVDASGSYSQLFVFSGGAVGCNPYGAPALDASGNLYGVTFGGGGASLGTVFKLSPDGVQTTLHIFGGKGDGAVPYSVILDAAGTVYGVASEGGYMANQACGGQGCGTVFKITQ
jgi:uncharacterized repeat protein (TIGR03803 family)